MLIDVFLAGFAIFLVASVVHYSYARKKHGGGCGGGCQGCMHHAACQGPVEERGTEGQNMQAKCPE